MEYTFTLKFKLPDHDTDIDAVVERLGEAGCDDALVGIGIAGRIALTFSREAQSAEVALVSALSDVKRAIPDAKLIEAAPDFVGLTDVADAIGVTRQNMRKLMLTHAASFPAPVHEGSTAVWHLADVLAWLQSKGTYALDEPLVDIAKTTMQINLVKAATRIVPRMKREVSVLVD